MNVNQLSDIDVQAIQLPVLQENRWLQVIAVLYNLLAVAYASALPCQIWEDTRWIFLDLLNF